MHNVYPVKITFFLRCMQHKTSSAHVSISKPESVHHDGSPRLNIVDTQMPSQNQIISESNLPIKSEERTSYPKNLTEGLVSAAVSALTWVLTYS